MDKKERQLVSDIVELIDRDIYLEMFVFPEEGVDVDEIEDTDVLCKDVMRLIRKFNEQ